MKSLRQKMSFEDFEVMEWRFGWKHEYWDDQAHITPRERGVLVKIPVAPRESNALAQIVTLENAAHVTAEDLSDPFFASFVETVEYCDWKETDVQREARRCIQNVLTGQGRGEPQMDLSRVALLPESRMLAGAALVVRRKYGVKLEILFVVPEWQRRGIGTALAAAVINDLHQRGEKILWSEHHICNEQSQAWHKKFGFVEEPDLSLAQMRRNYWRHEVWRHEKTGDTTRAEEVKPWLAQAEMELQRLKEIERTQGYEVANLHWKWE